MTMLIKGGAAVFIAALGFGGGLLKPNVATSLPPADEPMQVRALFEHVILAEQDDDNFNVKQVEKSCEQRISCQQYYLLFSRYLSFKLVLSEFHQEIAFLPLSEQLSQLLAFQHRYFTESEIELLFNDDNQWQEYTIEKLRINQDDSLNTALKAQLLESLDASQPDYITESLKPSKDLIALNNEFKRAVESQDYNQLAAEFGGEAATRLISLQKERQQWLALNEKLLAQIKIIKEQYPEKQQAEQKIASLLDKHLTVNQQRRFLAINP